MEVFEHGTERVCVCVWAAIEGPRDKMTHLLGGVDICVGRDQPVDYLSVPVPSREIKRGGPVLRSEQGSGWQSRARAREVCVFMNKVIMH